MARHSERGFEANLVRAKGLPQGGTRPLWHAFKSIARGPETLLDPAVIASIDYSRGSGSVAFQMRSITC